MKKCRDCDCEEPTAACFPRGRSLCKVCVAARQRAYNEKNREKINKLNRESRSRHPDAAKARQKKWCVENPEKLRAIRKRAMAKQYPKIRARFLASADLQKKQRAAGRDWYHRNLDLGAVYYHRRRARLLGNGGDFTRQQWRECKDYFNHRCAYCLAEAPLEMEHVDPLSKGGLHSDQNIVPACKACNGSKHNATLLQWLFRLQRERA